MALYGAAKTIVDNNIFDNTDELITGAIHNNVMHEVIDAVGAAQVYVNPSVSDDPGTPENPRAYIVLPGTYVHFLTAAETPAVITSPIGVLRWNGGPYWTAYNLPIPSPYNYFRAITTAALSNASPYTTVNIIQSNGGWTAPVGQWIQIINRHTGAHNFVQLTAALDGDDTSITFKAHTTTSAFPVGSIVEAYPQLNMRKYVKHYAGDGTNDYIDLPSTWRLVPEECTDPDVWGEMMTVHVNLLEGKWAAEPAEDAEYNIEDDETEARRRLKFSRVMLPSDLIKVEYWQPTIL